MTRIQRAKRFDLGLLIKKSALSGFVVLTFLAYVIDQQLSAFRQTTAIQPTNSTTNNQTQAPTTQIPQASQGQYRDGSYTGPVTDAFYGQMQVQAIVQGGKLTQVQILQYPHDRRTSQNINSQALPYLQSEAIQAQNAQIDFVSGATLSSNAFVQSLQSALQNAKG